MLSVLPDNNETCDLLRNMGCFRGIADDGQMFTGSLICVVAILQCVNFRGNFAMTSLKSYIILVELDHHRIFIYIVIRQDRVFLHIINKV